MQSLQGQALVSALLLHQILFIESPLGFGVKQAQLVMQSRLAQAVHAKIVKPCSPLGTTMGAAL